MTTKAHTHDLTLRALAGANASGTRPFLFHQLLTWHAFPQLQKRKEPEAPELWKSFCDGYEVSTHGRVRSRRQVLVNLLDSRDEPYQIIRGRWHRVKRLVADAFIPNPDGKRRLRHINGNSHDCHADNLEWW